MWEHRNQEGPRTFHITGGLIEPKRCKCCGQYMLKGEEYYIIVCNAIPEARAQSLENLIVHTKCWDKFCDGIEDNLVLATKLKKYRMPSAKPFTEEQKRDVEAFKKAAAAYGYWSSSKTRNGCIKAVKNGTTCSVLFNPYSGVIKYEDRRKNELLKSLFDRQIETNIFNKMHEFLGDGKHDDYSALGTIAGVIEETNKFFN